MYRIVISPKARRGLKNIRKKSQRKIIVQIIEELKNDPYFGKSLTRDMEGKYSYRTGIDRIIYIINEKDKVVNVLSVGNRRIIYTRKI